MAARAAPRAFAGRARAALGRGARRARRRRQRGRRGRRRADARRRAENDATGARSRCRRRGPWTPRRATAAAAPRSRRRRDGRRRRRVRGGGRPARGVKARAGARRRARRADSRSRRGSCASTAVARCRAPSLRRRAADRFARRARRAGGGGTSERFFPRRGGGSSRSPFDVGRRGTGTRAVPTPTSHFRDVPLRERWRGSGRPGGRGPRPIRRGRGRDGYGVNWVVARGPRRAGGGASTRQAPARRRGAGFPRSGATCALGRVGVERGWRDFDLAPRALARRTLSRPARARFRDGASKSRPSTGMRRPRSRGERSRPQTRRWPSPSRRHASGAWARNLPPPAAFEWRLRGAPAESAGACLATGRGPCRAGARHRRRRRSGWRVRETCVVQRETETADRSRGAPETRARFVARAPPARPRRRFRGGHGSRSAARHACSAWPPASRRARPRCSAANAAPARARRLGARSGRSTVSCGGGRGAVPRRRRRTHRSPRAVARPSLWMRARARVKAATRGEPRVRLRRGERVSLSAGAGGAVRGHSRLREAAASRRRAPSSNRAACAVCAVDARGFRVARRAESTAGAQHAPLAVDVQLRHRQMNGCPFPLRARSFKAERLRRRSRRSGGTRGWAPGALLCEPGRRSQAPAALGSGGLAASRSVGRRVRRRRREASRSRSVRPACGSLRGRLSAVGARTATAAAGLPA